MVGVGFSHLFSGLAIASGFGSQHTAQSKWSSTAPHSHHKQHKKSSLEKGLGAVGTLLSYRLRGMPLTRREYPHLQALANSGDKGSYAPGTYGDKYPYFLLSLDSNKNKKFWDDHKGDKEWCKQAYSQQVSYSNSKFGADAVFRHCSVSGAYPAERGNWEWDSGKLGLPSPDFSWALS